MPRKKSGWSNAGTFVIPGSANYRIAKNGRAYDPGSGRFLSKASAAKRRTKDVNVKVEKTYSREYTEVTYRAKFSKKLSEKTKLEITKQIVKAMRKDGVRTLPKRKGKDASVRFFAFVEGQAVDAKSKKRVRAGTGISRNRSLKATEEQTKSKVKALFEGASLANDPFKTTGSGQQSMKQGPDTIYITAVYAEGFQAPIRRK